MKHTSTLFFVFVLVLMLLVTCQLIAQPSTQPSPNLPPPPGTYISPDLFHQLYAAGVVIKDVSHDRFTNSEPPPETTGTNQVHTFGSEVRGQVSFNNGMTFDPFMGNANCMVRVEKTGEVGNKHFFDTEMLMLDISGGNLPAGCMIRESPTMASMGKTNISSTMDGMYHIDSFFDVFTELSLDGGQSWMPAQNGSTHMELQGTPPPVIVRPVPDLPPDTSHYVNPFDNLLMYANGVLVRKVSHRNFTNNQPPPPPGPPQQHSFGSDVHMEVSMDGGMTWDPQQAPATVMVLVTNTGTQVYDTEMLSLDISGGTLPPGVHLRESPTRASLGRTSITPLPGGGYEIGSFFDIFTEISLDGQMTWAPSSGSHYVEVHELPPDSGMICGMKWEDLNGNGVKEPGEQLLAGWKIQATDVNTGQVYSAVTDAVGNYCFKLPTGTYRVEEVLQAGWMQTGGQPFYTLNVAGGQTITGIDFGNFKNGSIYGMKFNDHNGDGFKDPGDEGLPGWTICLMRKQPPPDPTWPTTGGTDYLGGTLATVDINFFPAYGGVSTTICASGPTSIQRANPTGPNPGDLMKTEITVLEMIGTLPPPFPNDTFLIRHVADRRSYGQIQNSSPYISFFDVFYELEVGGKTFVNYQATNMNADGGITTIPPSGQNYLGYNTFLVNKNDVTDTLGLIKKVNHCVGGGSQPGTEGCPCPTKAPPNPNPPGAPLGTTCVTTDANGNYCFMNLPPGNYNISEVQQSGWTQTTPNPGTIPIESGGAVTGVNFGNKGCGGSVCVTKYYDENHNQILDPTEVPMEGVKFTLTLSTTTTTYSATTDISGRACFNDLPSGLYDLTEILPAGYGYSLPKDGVIRNLGVDDCNDNFELLWLNTAARTDSSYRTATAEQWATALDQKNKRKAVKCKPHQVDFKLNLVVPNPFVNDAGQQVFYSKLELKFSMPTNILGVWEGKSKQFPYCYVSGNPVDPVKKNVWVYDLNNCNPPNGPPNPGTLIQFDGLGLKGKLIKVSYKWTTKSTADPGGVKGSLPGKPAQTGSTIPDSLKNQNLRLPMPNLHNVGEELFAQGVFPLHIGGKTPTTDSNVVLLKKYFDAVKALGKDNRGVIMLHDTTGLEDCFRGLAKAGKPKSGLSPDKINNKIFAEILALKLNIAASQKKKFPLGFDQLIYDYHKVQQGPYDGQPITEILFKAQHYLRTCQLLKGGTPADLYFVLRLINRSFAGPIDTIRWNCFKLELTGVRTLKEVPWLHAIPGTTIPAFVPSENTPVNLVPENYALHQNYPNPFNPVTTIQFDLPVPSVVTLKVYNLLGQEVATLYDHELFDEGAEEVEFDATSLTSGVYIYRIVAQALIDEEDGVLGQTYIDVKKMLLIK